MGILIADFKGLETASGFLVRDASSCRELVNVSMGKRGIIATRNGFDLSAHQAGCVWKSFSPEIPVGYNWLHKGSSSEPSELVYMDLTASPIDLSPVEWSYVKHFGPSERMKMAQCGADTYVTSNRGVMRSEKINVGGTSLWFAGISRGQAADLYDNDAAVYAVLSGGGGPMLSVGYARNYRVTFQKLNYDGDGEKVLVGPPTSRTLIHNAAGTSGYGAVTAKVTLRLPIPKQWGCETATLSGYTMRLWGSRMYNLTGGEAGTDDMYLIMERELSAGDIATGYFAYTDTTPDAFLITSPPLNTNPNVIPPLEIGLAQGISNADNPPPIAKDIAYHQNCMWYANAVERTRVRLTLNGAIAAGGTVAITGPNGTATLTCVAATPVGGATNFIGNPGLTTTSLDIDRCAANIAACANRNFATTGVYCYHDSSPNTEPGVLIFEATDNLGTAVSVVVSIGSTPYRQETFTTGGTNSLFFSKQERPDSVPEVNELKAGPQNTEILRITPFRERMLVFTDHGIYQVTGNNFQNFTVSPFDLSYKLIAPESVALVDDRVYCLTLQGIVEIDDGGVEVISKPIKNFTDAMTASEDMLTAASEITFGVGYRLKHEYRLFYPSVYDVNEPNPNEAPLSYRCDYWLTFDTATRAWSQGHMVNEFDGFYDAAACGVVLRSNDKLTLGAWEPVPHNDGGLWVESIYFTDAPSDGTPVLAQYVFAIVGFQFAAPNPEGLVHWQQVVAKFQPAQAEYTRPWTDCLFYWENEYDQNEYSYAFPNDSNPECKSETPTEVRRSARLSVKVKFDAPQPNDLSRPAELAGLSISYAEPTRYAKN